MDDPAAMSGPSMAQDAARQDAPPPAVAPAAPPSMDPWEDAAATDGSPQPSPPAEEVPMVAEEAPGVPAPVIGSRAPDESHGCPYLQVPGAGWRGVEARREHRCVAVDPPMVVTVEKQRRLCLVGEHAACPLYEEAQYRRASTLAAVGLSDAMLAERRSRPLVRATPLVIDGRGAGGVRSTWIASRMAQAVIGFLALAAIAAFVGARLVGTGGGGPVGGPDATTAIASLDPGETSVAPATAAPGEGLPSPDLTTPPVTPATTPPPATQGPTTLPTAEPSARPTAKPTAAPPAATRTYRVKKGDTLFAIAQRFDTTVVAIIKLNAIKDPTLIRVGQVLKIP